MYNRHGQGNRAILSRMTAAIATLRAAVRREVDAVGLTRWANRIGVPVGQVRSVYDGRDPKSGTLERLCETFGFEFYIGPDRKMAKPKRPTLAAETDAHRWADRRGKEITPYPVPMHEGHRPERVGFSPNGCAHFGLEFLLNFDLDPDRCEVVEIFDESMAPEFPAGAAGLVDLRQTERKDGRVYALGVPHLTVRRARKGDGGWVASPDNPEFVATPWSKRFTIVGQVVWTSHMVGVEPTVDLGEGGR